MTNPCRPLVSSKDLYSGSLIPKGRRNLRRSPGLAALVRSARLVMETTASGGGVGSLVVVDTEFVGWLPGELVASALAKTTGSPGLGLRGGGAPGGLGGRTMVARLVSPSVISLAPRSTRLTK